MTNFIIIDDDPINNRICTKYISVAFPGAAVESFTSPVKGLEYVTNNLTADTVLLLDINMPVLTGWDVLDRLALLPDEQKRWLTTYILSSSVGVHDKEKAAANPLVSGFLEKPLSVPVLQGLVK